MAETQEQVQLFNWIRTNQHQWPALGWTWHAPNGGSRGATRAERGRNGAIMEAQGVKKGVHDILNDIVVGVFAGFRGEMKYDDNKLEPEQEEFLDLYLAQGFFACVAYTWQEMAYFLCMYLNLPKEAWRSVGPFVSPTKRKIKSGMFGVRGNHVTIARAHFIATSLSDDVTINSKGPEIYRTYPYRSPERSDEAVDAASIKPASGLWTPRDGDNSGRSSLIIPNS